MVVDEVMSRRNAAIMKIRLREWSIVVGDDDEEEAKGGRCSARTVDSRGSFEGGKSSAW